MLTMESIFRRLLNAGIGVASKTTRFAEDLINDLVQKGKLSEDEGRKFMEDFEREGEEQRQVFEKEMNAYIEKALQKMDIPSREDYRRLEERVSILEKSQPGATQVNTIKP
jgi:polyhydroxyalkanoate synthesis regulator phasin